MVQCHFLTDVFDLVYLNFRSKVQKAYLCTERTAAYRMFEPFGENGAKYPVLYKLYCENMLLKLIIKRYLQNQCEKLKKPVQLATILIKLLCPLSDAQ